MNFERWKGLRDFRHPPACMDWRHVNMVHEMLVGENVLGAVEIGCWRGFGTAALVEADEKGGIAVDLVDLKIQDSVRKIAPRHWWLLEMNSWDYRGSPQCWIIDGNHDFGEISDYAKACRMGARIVVIHDTNGGEHRLLPYNVGASFVGALVKRDFPYFFEDKEERPGERTHRGLVIGFRFEPEKETVAKLKWLAGPEFKVEPWDLEEEDGVMKGEPMEDNGKAPMG